MTGKIIAITIYHEKGGKGQNVSDASLTPSDGIVGNRHNDICLQTKTARQFMENNPCGLCFAKFKANIIFDAGIEDSIAGTADELQFGEVVLKKAGGKKFCFDQCLYFSHDKTCPMHNGVIFAKVVKGGFIKGISKNSN